MVFFYTFPDLQCVTFSLSGILTSASLEQVHLLDICPGKQHNFTDFTDFTDELHKVHKRIDKDMETLYFLTNNRSSGISSYC